MPYMAHRERGQRELPGMGAVTPEETPSRGSDRHRYRRNHTSRGPIHGGMPIFDSQTGAEIMSVQDDGGESVTIYVEDMSADGQPGTLIPRSIHRRDYEHLLRSQTKRPRRTR
jgi:hypothetical protein